MTQDYSRERDVAIEAVREASLVCRLVQRRMITPQTMQKKDKSPVTVADFASQAVVCWHLREHLPDDLVVGEEDAAGLRCEDGGYLRQTITEYVNRVLDLKADENEVLSWIDRGNAKADTDRYWTLDPIDGTKGYLRDEQFAVALALLVDKQVVLSVLGCPGLKLDAGIGALFVSEKGKGSYLLPLWDTDQVNRQPIRVSDVSRSMYARFCESVESAHSDQGASQQIAQRLGITAQPLRLDSQAKYAMVARGDAQIYLRLPTRADYRECIWDHAAGMLTVQEAGGIVTDIDGKPLDFSKGKRLEHNRGIVATNGKLHDKVLSVVQSVLGQ